MNEPGFTPGPWVIGNRYGRSRTEIVSSDGSKALATVWTHRAETGPQKNHLDDVLDDEGAANLHLIAEAPNLLSNLEALVMLVEMDDEASNTESDLYVALFDARLSIAKARGHHD